MIKKLFKLVLFIVLVIIIAVLYRLNYIPHLQFSASRFNIDENIIASDKDEDGIDDLTDTILGVKAYLETKPKYKSKYYGTGYPDDQYGVCTDVVAFGLKNAGYDLMNLVYDDIWLHNDEYKNVDVVDINIDFRRVENLQQYFINNYQPLTLDYNEIEEWIAGDIVIFEGHIGVIADVRNYKGIAFVYHHGSPIQSSYLQDVLGYYKIVGHYRMIEEYKLEQ